MNYTFIYKKELEALYIRARRLTKEKEIELFHRRKNKMEKEQLVKIMIDFLDKETYKDLPPILENDKQWTMADLFIRQALNNGGSGFGLNSVNYVYAMLKGHKELLVKENMISKNGFNNSGFSLWEDYNF
jgi:hypothetical protein